MEMNLKEHRVRKCLEMDKNHLRIWWHEMGVAGEKCYLEIEALFIFFLLYLVQHECIPQAILGMDVLCQAKSGMGKTAVFVLATLQQLEPVTGQVQLGKVSGRALGLGMWGRVFLAQLHDVFTTMGACCSDDLCRP